MCYLSIFLVGAVIGMLISIFLHAYFSKGNIERRENKFLATKDDVAQITEHLEELKALHKKSIEEKVSEVRTNETKNKVVADEENETIEIPETEEILEAEKEFYDSIAGE